MKFQNGIFLLLFFCIMSLSYKCKNTEKVIENIYSNANHSDDSYKTLEYLCKNAKGRLPGSLESEKAIEFVKSSLKKYGTDSVWLFPVNAPGWKEIKQSSVEMQVNDNQNIKLNSVTLGQCVSTSESGVIGRVVMITSREQIDSIGEKGLKDKIVFFNQKMKVRTDYGKTVWQRTQGASLVSKYGAKGVLVRSITTKHDDNPHTGLVRYTEDQPKIPAVAISWQAADTLEKYLKINPSLEAHIKTFTENPGLIKSYNVIGELKGSRFPDKILLITAHLDAWHNTQGAHDNAGGVSQIIDVIRIYKELNIKPRHTIRVMAYTDEEQTLSGIKQFAESQKSNNQTHLLDIEVDYGIGVPVGYNIQADSTLFTKQKKWIKYLNKQELNTIKFTNSYATGWPLFKTDSTVLSHLVCTDEHYFDYHHSQNDVIEAINKSNLQSGSAALAAFIYLIDKLEVIKP